MKRKHECVNNTNEEQSRPSTEEGRNLFRAAEAVKGNARMYYGPRERTTTQKFLPPNSTRGNQLLWSCLLKQENQQLLKFASDQSIQLHNKGVQTTLHHPSKESLSLLRLLTSFKPTKPATMTNLPYHCVYTYAEGLIDTYFVTIAVNYRYYQNDCIYIDMFMVCLYIAREEFIDDVENVDLDQLDIIDSTYSLPICAESHLEEQREKDSSFIECSSIDMLVFVCEMEIENFDGPDVESEESLESPPSKKKQLCDCAVHLPEVKKKLETARIAHIQSYYARYGNCSTQHLPFTSYREENKILLEHIFDSNGNYRYCHKHIREMLNMPNSEHRLARLRKVKQGELPFHGLMDRPSNSTISTTTLQKLGQFFELNSQFNGRQQGKTHYIDPKFTQFYVPSLAIQNNPKRPWNLEDLKRCFLFEFNRIQQDCQQETISNGTLHTLLHTTFCQYARYPHKSDYCNVCNQFNIEILQCHAILNRENVTGDERRNQEQQKTGLMQKLQDHKKEAQAEIEYYRTRAETCTSQYDEIQRLMQLGHQDLQGKQLAFHAVISADYQQGKLLPYWGRSPQAGETYYYRKLNHDIFGIVNHCTWRNNGEAKPVSILAEHAPIDTSMANTTLHCPSQSILHHDQTTVFINDERQGGPKCANHTISHLNQYIEQVSTPWIQHLDFYMDNAATNKNWMVLAWAHEIVKFSDHITSIRISFMLPGMNILLYMI